MEFLRIHDEPYYAVWRAAAEAAEDETGKRERLHQPYYITGRTDNDRVLVHAERLDVRQEPFSAPSLVARLEAAVGRAPVESETLPEYDSYYYSRTRMEVSGTLDDHGERVKWLVRPVSNLFPHKVRLSHPAVLRQFAT